LVRSKFNNYLSDRKASVYRVKAPLLNLHSMRMWRDQRSREDHRCGVTVADGQLTGWIKHAGRRCVCLNQAGGAVTARDNRN